MQEYPPLTILTDPNDFKDDLDVLWIFATALLAATVRGALQQVPGSDALATALDKLCTAIENAD